MKVIAVNGSHNPDGNTYHALKVMCEELNAQGIETEILQIGMDAVQGCIGCCHCRNEVSGLCVFDDIVNEHAEKIKAADGVIFGAPVHYAGVSGDMKSYMDRLFYSASKQFARKVAAGVVSVRRSGGVVTADQFNRYFSIAGMIVAPSCYWNVIHGDAKGEVLQDFEGVDTLKTVAANMGWLIRVLAETKVELPQIPACRKTNFIR
ncbi:MAG: flavodoxin family protein [Oscillospiraceae bacterium]|nr:flavodoxin family protein [Oscillospiraceae bacterium]